jgi:DNA-binding transcriptional regulator YiaG
MKKLKNGWVEGSVKDFLHLSDADVEYIELRRTLSRLLKSKRQKLRLTQMEVAARLRTSQSRVAKMEKADATVSSDLLLQSLFRLGLKRKELAGAMRRLSRSARRAPNKPGRPQSPPIRCSSKSIV